ncbi:MerR family transcriptional regulator [Clostridium sporogenes]|uniref:MerR family transcriptional regulator n=1 Tax=Clostridium sporogenes TaxID=1509 RepID=UPI0013D5ACD7|nr:MerR family transcriptional regulator [Clostridium sporogenes]NFM15859.1 MerR family transcriptional regulator [Clostridium sporogenes]
MLSIGEFSKICEVSTKTLRYYAEIGLINPDEINPENGYRYYSIKQLKKMLFINRLKSYNFSLKEIKEILELEEDQSEEKLYSILNYKKKEMKEQMRIFEKTLEQLNNDILNLNMGKSIMAYLENIDVQLVEVSAMCILSVRKMVSIEDCEEGYGKFFNPIFEKIATGKLTIIAPPMTIYHSTEYTPSGYDIEFAIPIKEYVVGTREFHPGLCLKTVVTGSYSEITSIYAKQREWAEKEGYVFAKPPYDVYVTNPTQVSTSKELITEVYCPVKKK